MAEMNGWVLFFELAGIAWAVEKIMRVILWLDGEKR